MKKFTGLLAALCSAIILLFAGASHAALVELDFSNYQGTLNDSTMGGTGAFALGAGCTTTSPTFGCVTDEGGGVYSMSFTDVGTDGTTTLDAIVSFSTTGNGTTLIPERGIIPDYRSVDTNEPNNDFGFLYDGNTFDTMSGIDFTFTFYDGTGAASGTYADLFEVSELNLVVYDVDGESTSAGSGSTQDEYVTAFTSDGLTAYALDATNPMFVNCDDGVGGTIARCTDPGAGAFRFDGPDANRAEDSTEGAVFLQYMNTSSLTLSFGSFMVDGSNPNPVFSAIDGDLSLFNVGDFDDPVSVPEPTSIWLLGAGLLGISFLRRRRTAA